MYDLLEKQAIIIEDLEKEIEKHENKYKNCRFEMIDVEDPLWEYGYPLKRVLIDNQTGETYDEVGKLVGLLNELVTKYHKLEKENEKLKQKLDFYLLDEFEWKEKYGDCDE